MVLLNKMIRAAGQAVFASCGTKNSSLRNFVPVASATVASFQKAFMASGASAVPRSGGQLSSSNSAAVAAAGAGNAPTSVNSAFEKMISTLQSELQHEKGNYEQAENIQRFLSTSGWSLEEKEGDINMKLKKSVPLKLKGGSVGDLAVTVEFQLVSPTYSSEEDEEGAGGDAAQNQPEPQETTDFSVTCERVSSGAGAIFYCTTVASDEKFRFIVGNMRYYSNAEEKNSISAYTGPEFEDLDDVLQGGVDSWLASLGINEELCDFVDAMAVDKEQREYIRWLKSVAELIQP